MKTIVTPNDTFLLVKVAPDANNPRISAGYPDPPKGDLAYDTDLNVWKTGDAILPPGQWLIMGDAFNPGANNLSVILPSTYHARRFNQWMGILKANEVHQVNPLQSEWDEACTWGHGGCTFQEYHDAADNTGNYLLLQKLE